MMFCLGKEGRKIKNLKNKISLAHRKMMCKLDIERAVTKLYNGIFEKPLDLEKPETFQEKLQYLKLKTYYNNPVITECVDKYCVRDYIRRKIVGGETIINQLYGVYENPDEIEWETLPNSFVIKCNHGCGYNILCPDKASLNREETIKKLKKWMKEDYWIIFAEPQYKYVKKRIIIEKYLGDNIKTYKFYCFKEHILGHVVFDGEHGEQDYYHYFFDTEWNRLDYVIEGHVPFPGKIECPKNFDRMLEIVKALKEDFPFVRVDLYNLDGDIFLSELTFIPLGGYAHYLPEGTDYKWGSWIEL